MLANLGKGHIIDIEADTISICIGWDFLKTTTNKFKVDLSAFMLNIDRVIANDNFFVFYGTKIPNKKKLPTEGALRFKEEDNGKVMIVELLNINKAIREIVFVGTISNKAEGEKHCFKQLKSSYINIVDEATNRKIAKYELNDIGNSNETSVEVGRLYRRKDKWKFQALGVGYQESINFFIVKYYQGLDLLK